MTPRAVSVLLAGAALAGCGQRAEKPAPMTCEGRCAPSTPGTVGHVGPPAPTGGAGGESGTDDDTPVRLEGEVRILNDIDALTGALFTDSAAILVQGETNGVLGEWHGTDDFSIQGVRRGPAVWAQVTPVGADALLTLMPVNTTKPNASGVVSTVLTVVRESELDAAYGVVSMPIMRDEDKAQAILVVTSGGRRAAGIGVVVLGAEAVLYAANGSFSDTATSTDASGIALVVNIPSVPWPGSTVSVALPGNTTTRSAFQVVTRGVTLAGVGD